MWMSALLLGLWGLGEPPDSSAETPPTFIQIAPEKATFIAGEPIRLTLTFSNPFRLEDIDILTDEHVQRLYGNNGLGLTNLRPPLQLTKPVRNSLRGVGSQRIKPGEMVSHTMILQSDVSGLRPGEYVLDYNYPLTYWVVDRRTNELSRRRSADQVGKIRFSILDRNEKKLEAILKSLYEDISSCRGGEADVNFDSLALVDDPLAQPWLVKSLMKVYAGRSDQFRVAMRRLKTDPKFSREVADALESDDPADIACLVANLGVERYELSAAVIEKLKNHKDNRVRDAAGRYYK